MTEIIFREPELEYMLKSPVGMVGKHIDMLGKFVMAAAKLQVGVRTGALKMSIHSRIGMGIRGPEARIGSSLSYALMHHEGTKPHLILPKHAHGTLRFSGGGRIIYTRKVMHPGTRPNHYLTDSLHVIQWH